MEARHVIEKALEQTPIHSQITTHSAEICAWAENSGRRQKMEQFIKEQAFSQAVQWFNFHLKGCVGEQCSPREYARWGGQRGFMNF